MTGSLALLARLRDISVTVRPNAPPKALRWPSQQVLTP